VLSVGSVVLDHSPQGSGIFFPRFLSLDYRPSLVLGVTFYDDVLEGIPYIALHFDRRRHFVTVLSS
jgi:hypothetical protein